MNDLLAIKGRFKAPETKLFGLYLLMLNQDGGFIENTAIISSVHPEIYNETLKTGFSSFEDKINRLQYDGRCKQDSTYDLQEALKSVILDEESYKDLDKSVKKKDMKGIAHFMSTLISRVLHDPQVTTDIEIQNVTNQDLEKARKEAEAAEADSKPAASATPPEETTLDISLVLAPVGGKLVTDLKPGEKIMVKILPVNDRAEYYFNLLGLRNEKRISPAPAELISITEGLAGSEIKVKIADGVFGKVTEEEKVLVRLYDENDEAKKEEKKKPGAKQRTSAQKSRTPLSTEKRSDLFFKLFLAIAVILLLLIIWVLAGN